MPPVPPLSLDSNPPAIRSNRPTAGRRFGCGLGFACLLLASVAHAEFRAGIATRVVTPDPLLPVSGGIGPSKPTQRKQGDLTVRALVLRQGTQTVAIASVDFLGFPAVLGDRVRKAVPQIPPRNILIGATHTHSAPDCYGFPDQTGPSSIDLGYVDRVCGQLAEAVREAFERAQPARLRAATGEAKGRIAYNYYAEQLYDPRCHVLQFVDTAGKPFATLVNYAIHPEVLGPDQGILSPDLIGPLYDRITAAGGGTGIFLNSAQGGMVTADCRGPDGKDIQTWAECVRIGSLLADEALRIVAAAPLQENPPLATLARTVEFPIDSPMLRQILKASPLAYPDPKPGFAVTTLNLVIVGDTHLLTVPGEAMPNIGYYLKRKMKGRNNLLLGLTNDAFGYILTKEDWGSFKRYDYITRTCLGERTGEILIEQALELVRTATDLTAANSRP